MSFTKIFGWLLLAGGALFLMLGGVEGLSLKYIILIATYFIAGAILAK